MEIESYISELKNIVAEFSKTFSSVNIGGEGLASFVNVTNGELGLELYRHNQNIIIDPSRNNELIGERKYPSYEKAMVSAVRYLNEGKID